VVGVFDLASNVSEGSSIRREFTVDADAATPGIRNTTTVFDIPERDRVRLVSLCYFANLLYSCLQPRHVPADGVLVVNIFICLSCLFSDQSHSPILLAKHWASIG
jgi:hypothetical protein